MASDPHSAEVGAVEHGSGGAEFPPFDFTTFVPQLFWLAITFTVLYVVLARVALPRIATALEERRDKIADDLDSAEQLRRQAEEALAEYEKAISEARAEAAKIIRDARNTIKTDSDSIRAEVDAELSASVSAAEARINDAKNEAISEMRDVAVDIASDISGELLGAIPPRDVVEQAVDGQLKLEAA